MTDHSSKQYDIELETLRSRVLEMGGLVEAQIRAADRRPDIRRRARARRT